MYIVMACLWRTLLTKKDKTHAPKCFLRNKQYCKAWPTADVDDIDHHQIGNHAKFFMIDDCAYYIGSQNLYVADLSEWGLLVDDAGQTRNVIKEYWHPLWSNSWDPTDFDADKVMEGLNIDRNDNERG